MNTLRKIFRPIPGILVLCIACDKQEEQDEGNNLPIEETDTPIPTVRQESLSFEQTIPLAELLPELQSSPFISESDKYGFYISPGDQVWNTGFTPEPIYFPAQSHAFSISTEYCTDVPSYKEPYLRIYKQEYVILKDLQLPEGIHNLTRASSTSNFSLYIALSPDAPCSKVRLQNIIITFPEWFHADYIDTDAKGVTAEGTRISLRMKDFYYPKEFIDEEGHICYSVPIYIFARVIVNPEHITDDSRPINEVPFDFNCSFDFEQMDFASYTAERDSDLVSADSMEGVSIPLPEYLSSPETPIQLQNPILDINFRNDFYEPQFYSFRVSLLPKDNTPLSFTLGSTGLYSVIPKTRTYYYNYDGERIEIEGLSSLFSLPPSGDILFPTVEFLPRRYNNNDGPFRLIVGQTYEAKAEMQWIIPLSFTGQLAERPIQTSPLLLSGDDLDVPAGSSVTIQQTFLTSLPFSCKVTPILQIEGEEPVRLDTFTLDAVSAPICRKTITAHFTPSSDHWKASLYYLITPSKGNGCALVSSFNLTITESALVIVTKPSTE